MPAVTHEQAAAGYLARGWSVIPMREKAKRPAIAWKRYQTRCVTEEGLHDWFQRSPNYNVGIVTGKLSGLVVLDVDPGHGGTASLKKLAREEGRLPQTMAAITGGGGRHFYFRHPGEEVHNRAGIRPGIDLRGDGGCIVAPPSVHPSGKRYRWVKGRAPGQIEPALLPDWLR